MNAAIFGRPNRARLEHWLEHDPDRFERYLEAHPEVADWFDDLAALPATAKALIGQALDAPAGLVERLASRLEEAKVEAASVSIDLLGTGGAALWLLLGDEP